jgi:PPP family 3-phenylpropionic acid transporter
LGLPGGGGADGNQVLMLVLAASVLLLIACIGMPLPLGLAPVRRLRWSSLGRFALSRRFLIFVLSAAALQSSHQLYYGFGTLIWRQYGLSDSVIGVLWAEGVVAEIVLFWYSAALVARVGPLGLMMLGGAAGLVRWILMGIVPGLAAAAVLQLLHAATFGASHLGAMHFLSRNVPPDAAASAQSLYSALSAGFGSGLVMLAAGTLYTAWGGGAYVAMALLSGLGLIGALWLRRVPQR